MILFLVFFLFFGNMPVVFLRRFLNLSAACRLRFAPRLSPASVEQNEPIVSENDANTDLSGKMVFDNERQRTADPRVPLEKKRPKRTVEDIVNATRKMRANYFQKNSTNPDNKVNQNFEAEKEHSLPNEEDFFGLPASPTTATVISDNKDIKRPSVNRAESDSQYFDGSENVEPKSSEELTAPLEDRTVKPRQEFVEKPSKSLKKEPKKVAKITKPDRDGEEDEETYAFDVAMQVRRQLEGRADLAKDSKGFRKMVGSTLDWAAMTQGEMFNHLRKTIIYNEDGIFAINKPYGLPCQTGRGGGVSVASSFELLTDWLGKLRQNNQKGQERQEEEEEIWCRLVHRLDRDTTGALLIATKQTMAAKLRYWFNERKVAKTYWAITRFVPKESEGIIDIPMYECELSKEVYRMNLIPATEASRKKDAVKAVTRYKVLDANSTSCALLELNPETGVKHQLRCHLGLGLATPILGDHKYSNSDSMKPQRLPPSVLQALEIRQAKVRSVPLHLHAFKLVLPEFVDGRTIVVTARPPSFFIDTARRLKLKLPNL